jgi:hypothetical protein
LRSPISEAAKIWRNHSLHSKSGLFCANQPIQRLYPLKTASSLCTPLPNHHPASHFTLKIAALIKAVNPNMSFPAALFIISSKDKANSRKTKGMKLSLMHIIAWWRVEIQTYFH